jgi:hypothetical protein
MTLDQDIIMIIELIAVIIEYFIGTIMIRKTLKIELKMTKKYFWGATRFFFIHATCRLLFWLSSYPYRYVDTLDILFYVGTILGLLGVVLLVYAIESTISPKTHHFFSIYGFIALIAMVITSFIQGEIGGYRYIIIVQYLSLPVLAVIILFIYLNVTIKSTGKVRKNAVLMLLAIVFLMLFEATNTNIINQIGPWVEYVGIGCLVGSFILLYISVTNYFAT